MVKETEQVELKLARSVINNLERKLGEVQNSNKIMRQDLNLMKTESVSPKAGDIFEKPGLNGV